MIISNKEYDLEETMRANDLSVEDIASKVGVSAMTVYRWKRKEATPKSRVVIKSLENFLNTLEK